MASKSKLLPSASRTMPYARTGDGEGGENKEAIDPSAALFTADGASSKRTRVMNIVEGTGSGPPSLTSPGSKAAGDGRERGRRDMEEGEASREKQED